MELEIGSQAQQRKCSVNIKYYKGQNMLLAASCPSGLGSPCKSICKKRGEHHTITDHPSRREGAGLWAMNLADRYCMRT